MLRTCIAAAAFFGALVAADRRSSSSVVPSHASHAPGNGNSGVPGCEALKNAGLGDRVLFPTDAGYEPEIATWWALNTRLRPYCLVLPESSQEVAVALKALVEANDGAGDWHIALRSGGHASTEINNIVQGVTIDLSMLNSTSYDSEAGVAHIGSGARWRDVYTDLAQSGVTVAGGRDGGVGVGGYLLGGGISFYQGEIGWSCDQVVNYEVVLGNGSIINANCTANADLWKALKGGGSNFGIVTRFDMEVLPSIDLYYELRFLSSNYSDAVVDLVVGYANSNTSLADDAIIAYYSHNSSISPDIYLAAIHVNTHGIANTPTPFDDVKNLPALVNVTTFQSMAEAAIGSQLPGGTRNAGSTLTFRNDPEIIKQCVQLHENYVETLKRSIDSDKFTTLMFFEPLPSYTLTMSKQQGGNMLGLENVHYNAMMWVAGVAVDSDEAAFAVAQAELNSMTAQVKELSVSLHGDMDFVYLNYADATQDPLGSYGNSNVHYMKEVAARYDPAGIFQSRIPGGFKISSVA